MPPFFLDTLYLVVCQMFNNLQISSPKCAEFKLMHVMFIICILMIARLTVWSSLRCSQFSVSMYSVSIYTVSQNMSSFYWNRFNKGGTFFGHPVAIRKVVERKHKRMLKWNREFITHFNNLIRKKILHPTFKSSVL